MLRFVLVCLVLMTVRAHADFDFSQYVILIEKGEIEKAVKKLSDVPDKKFNYSELQMKYFALGKWLSDLQKWSEARAHLEDSLKYGRTNAAYVFYLIAHSYKEEKKYDDAEKAFEQALDHSPSQYIIFQSRFEFSEIAMLKKQNAKARKHLNYLEKRWRGTPNYPEVLWRLAQVELQDNRKHLACRWARKLYSKYPGDPLVESWGVELSQNKIEGKQIGCLASRKDTQTRLKYLLLMGQSLKAKNEIDYLFKNSLSKDKYKTEILLVNHLERLGYPDEALKILLPYYESKKGDFGYLQVLGKVASRAAEFQVAIGSYERAYKLSPKSRRGKESLFTAAFLSYQIQDYDGAYRKFNQINKKFSGSGLAQDSRWHMAWLQYLKADYSGAEKAFASLLKEKNYLRRRRVLRPFHNDRTKYWLGMSQLKQGRVQAARASLTQLAENKSLGYYTILAKNRLLQLPDEELARPLASVSTVAEKNENEAIEETVAMVDPGQLFSPKVPEESDEDESEEKLQSANDDETEQVEKDSTVEGPQIIAGQTELEKAEIENEESVKVSAFSNLKLQLQFDRATQLINLGFNTWAKWELFGIELRTRNKNYLRTLMEAYIKVGSYNRASYISEVYFSQERMQAGVQINKDIWQYNYPRAYEKLVRAAAERFGVSENLIFSIMKAESHFNKDAYSPVGARGLMQIMPYTANNLSRLIGESGFVLPSDLLNPELNIKLGSRYLERLQKKFKGQVPLVAAGYNAGPHRVDGWLNSFGILDMDEFIEHVPFVETRNYMKKVVRNYALYNELYSSKPVNYAWLAEPVPVRVSERPSPRENWENLD